MEGAIQSVNTVKPYLDFEYSHILKDDYGESFHLFSGYYLGASVDGLHFFDMGQHLLF